MSNLRAPTSILIAKKISINFVLISPSPPPPQILFMKEYFFRTEMSIQPGLTLYMWRCTVLDVFCLQANQNLQKLLCLRYQMKKIFQKLDSFVVLIENTNFLPLGKIKPDGLTCQV